MKSVKAIHKTCVRAAAVFFMATGFVSAQTVINGSFEQGVTFNNALPLYAVDATSITGWTVASGDMDYIDSTRWQAGAGNRCLDLSGYGAGTIQQVVNGFTAGQNYQLTFLMAGNPEDGPAIKSLQASIGSATQTFSFDITGFSGANMGWSPRTLNFTATSPAMTLAFTSLVNGWAGPALDNVIITPVPEPSAVGLVGMGALTCLGTRLRRRS